jgi:O-antigen chain-terminating methyltransferase
MRDTYRFAPPEQVARLQTKYIRFFIEVGAKRVLDLGCGRGIFLRLLGDAGIEGVGVDISAEAVQLCRAAGFAVQQEDALAALHRFVTAGESFDGIFCSHLIEHLTGDGTASLIAGSVAVLGSRGRLVIVTPNEENLQVLTEGFWLDTSHTRFVPRLLIETLMIDAGLRIVTSDTDPDAVSKWHAVSRTRKLLWRLALGRTIVNRYLLSGLDAYVVGERVTEDRT